MIASGASAVCLRSHNEDAYRLAEPGESPPLYLVADGMGGHRGGEVASRLAVEAAAESFRDRATFNEGVISRLRVAWGRANARVFAEADRRPSLRGMGTTLTGLTFAWRDVSAGSYNETCERDALIAHVGDSRCYFLAAGEGRALVSPGCLVQVTDDHTMVDRWVREGRVSADRAATHRMRHVLDRAVGVGRSVPVDVARVRGVGAGDAFLLCSDGLTGALSDDALRRLLLAGADAEGVVDEAERAGAADNCTAIVVRV